MWKSRDRKISSRSLWDDGISRLKENLASKISRCFESRDSKISHRKLRDIIILQIRIWQIYTSIVWKMLLFYYFRVKKIISIAKIFENWPLLNTEYASLIKKAILSGSTSLFLQYILEILWMTKSTRQMKRKLIFFAQSGVKPLLKSGPSTDFESVI